MDEKNKYFFSLGKGACVNLDEIAAVISIGEGEKGDRESIKSHILLNSGASFKSSKKPSAITNKLRSVFSHRERRKRGRPAKIEVKP